MAQSGNFKKLDSIEDVMANASISKSKRSISEERRHKIFGYKDSIHRSYMPPEIASNIPEMPVKSVADEQKKILKIFMEAMSSLYKEFPELAKLSKEESKRVFRSARRLLKQTQAL